MERLKARELQRWMAVGALLTLIGIGTAAMTEHTKIGGICLLIGWVVLGASIHRYGRLGRKKSNLAAKHRDTDVGP